MITRWRSSPMTFNECGLIRSQAGALVDATDVANLCLSAGQSNA